MAGGLLTPPRPASVRQAWPRLAICACGVEVLLARHVRAGRPCKLEAAEVLPTTKCGECQGRGRVVGELRHVTTGRGAVADGKSPHYARGPVACVHCDGTGRRGEEIGEEHILVSAYDGIARPFTGDRGVWDAAHRPHRCRA